MEGIEMLALPEVAITPNSIHHMDLFALCNAMPSESVDMILCDLPYGTTACSWDTIIPIEPMWEQFKRIIKPRGAIVLTATEPFASRLRMSNINMYKYDWVWDKNNSAGFVLAPLRPFQVTENVLIFQTSLFYYPIFEKRGKPRNKGGYGKSDVYNIMPSESKSNTYYPKNIIKIGNADQTNKAHPTQKPVALFEYLIRTYTRENELVFDPCVGSGTTAVAARNTGRDYICGDFTREYVELARQRVQNSDPYQATVHENGVKQLSLFEQP